jgi:hypothetical protein
MAMVGLRTGEHGGGGSMRIGDVERNENIFQNKREMPKLSPQ